MALAGLVLGSLVVGVLIRVADSVLAREAQDAGALLSACGLLVTLLLLNDGEGLASVTVLVLIASLGWIVFLRLGRPQTTPAGPSHLDIPIQEPAREPVDQSA